MIPFLSDASPDAGPLDVDLLFGFAPKCPACAATMQPHASDRRAWWRCQECTLPLIG